MLLKNHVFICRVFTKRLLSSFVKTDQKGSIFTITIDRPLQRNAVNQKTAEQLRESFELFEESEEAKVAILTGSSGNFCSGYDLKEASNMSVQELSDICMKEEGPMGPTRMYFSKPIIAAISGYAVGGGLELALCCDLRVIEEDTIMGLFNRRFGVPLIDGGTIRLSQLIGLSRAMDFILTGRPIRAQEALNVGLANRVVPRGHAYEEAMKLANQIASFPQECLNADRASTYHNSYNKTSLNQAFIYEKTNAIHCLKEAKMGAQKFSSGIGQKGKFEHY